MLNNPDIGSHLRRLGKAFIFAGDMRTAGGLTYMGATEGPVTAALNPEYNETTFPEETGPAVHESDLMGENPVVTIPLILHNLETTYGVVSATGEPSGGQFGHVPAVETSLLIVPVRQWPTTGAGVSYDGSAWDPVGIQRSNWFGITRGYFNKTGVGWEQDGGNKRIQEVEFRGLYDHDEYIPEGLRSYFIGDPVEQGFADFRL
jgi:hypothetical protein